MTLKSQMKLKHIPGDLTVEEIPLNSNTIESSDNYYCCNKLTVNHTNPEVSVSSWWGL